MNSFNLIFMQKKINMNFPNAIAIFRYSKYISNESIWNSTEYWTQSGQSANTKRSKKLKF